MRTFFTRHRRLARASGRLYWRIRERIQPYGRKFSAGVARRSGAREVSLRERDGGGTKGGVERTEPRNAGEGGRPGGSRAREDERGRMEEKRADDYGGWAKGVGEGMSPELERWQSIDLVGFTVSFYLSLSRSISPTRDSRLSTAAQKSGASAHCFGEAVVS